MRKPERIDTFCNELAKIWKENACDWRFGQLMVNVLNSLPRDPFFYEEDEMIQVFRDYFSPKDNNKEGQKDA
jgi:hypothetical protein